jgi:hypothetical protein
MRSSPSLCEVPENGTNFKIKFQWDPIIFTISLVVQKGCFLPPSRISLRFTYSNIGCTSCNYSKLRGSGFIRIGSEMASLQIWWGRELLKCEFMSSWWTMAAGVERRVALKLPTHRLMHKDVGKRLKKVCRPLHICGRSYERWHDCWRGVVMVIMLFVLCEWWAQIWRAHTNLLDLLYFKHHNVCVIIMNNF